MMKNKQIIKLLSHRYCYQTKQKAYQSQWIPAVAKDISVWTVGPWHSVNCINCAV